MGPPLTESPGRCRAFERGQAGSPFGGKHNRLRRETRVLSNGGIGSRHPVPVIQSTALTRFGERPATGLAKVIGTCTTKENLGAVASGATATPVQDRGLKGR